MAEVFMNWEELAAAYKKLKADHDALRKLVDTMAEKFLGHVHGIQMDFGLGGVTTTKPLTQLAPIQPPTPGPTSEQRRAPAAPAEETR